METAQLKTVKNTEKKMVIRTRNILASNAKVDPRNKIMTILFQCFCWFFFQSLSPSSRASVDPFRLPSVVMNFPRMSTDLRILVEATDVGGPAGLSAGRGKSRYAPLCFFLWSLRVVAVPLVLVDAVPPRSQSAVGTGFSSLQITGQKNNIVPQKNYKKNKFCTSKKLKTITCS